MVDIIDITQQITINVIIPEGVGTIQNLLYPTEAEVGTTVDVTFDLYNSGYDDTLFAKVDGVDVFRGSVVAGMSQPVLYQFVMPATSVNLTIETGHEE